MTPQVGMPIIATQVPQAKAKEEWPDIVGLVIARINPRTRNVDWLFDQRCDVSRAAGRWRPVCNRLCRSHLQLNRRARIAWHLNRVLLAGKLINNTEADHPVFVNDLAGTVLRRRLLGRANLARDAKLLDHWRCGNDPS